MGTYVQLMPRMVQRRMEEMESKAAENAKAAEALASSSAQASPAAQTYGTSLSPLEEPPLLTASVTDDALGAGGSLARAPAFDTENNGLVSQSSSEVKSSSAAAPLTPATEEGWLNNPGKGPSYAASFPQPPVANAQITLESSPPVATATPKRSLSADALTVSTENPLSSGQQ